MIQSSISDYTTLFIISYKEPLLIIVSVVASSRTPRAIWVPVVALLSSGVSTGILIYRYVSGGLSIVLPNYWPFVAIFVIGVIASLPLCAISYLLAAYIRRRLNKKNTTT